MAEKTLAQMMEELSGLDDHQEVVRETYKRAPFGWPGGKWRSLSNLLPRLPYRNSYIETCGGSGIVLLNRKRSKLEVFNDRFSGVTAFYLCLQDRVLQEALAERLSYFIHSREMFIWARDTWDTCADTVERAARWFYSVKTSFGSIGRNWGRATDCNGMIGAKLSEAAKEFSWVHWRLKEAQIDNLDVIQCISDYDRPDSVIYIDPDYDGTARGHYVHNMDRAKHIEIINHAMSGQGFFAISGYPNPLYDDPCWKWDARYTWESFVSANPGAFTKTNGKQDLEADFVRSYATECLWIKDHSK